MCYNETKTQEGSLYEGRIYNEHFGKDDGYNNAGAVWWIENSTVYGITGVWIRKAVYRAFGRGSELHTLSAAVSGA